MPSAKPLPRASNARHYFLCSYRPIPCLYWVCTGITVPAGAGCRLAKITKQDLPSARSVVELEGILGLAELKQLHHAEAVCAVTGEGLDVAVDKLHEMIMRRRKLSKRERNKTR